ncbi:uncharacterized protein LOC116266432 [Nymphaea colorata]|nr:uncharacterized protein LOC116266432 [Nymphaea colorata]
MADVEGAYDLPELPLEKVSISGPLLSSLLQRFAAAGGDCDGLLFGHVRQLSAPKLQDDYDSFTDPSAAVAENVAAFITGYVCSGSPQSFYDAAGLLHLPTLDKFVAQQRQPEFDGAAPATSSTASSGLIGWFVGRRNTQLRPSMRERAVSSSLFNILPSNKNLASVRQAEPPRVFLLLSGSFSPQTPIHTHEYRAFEFLRRGSFVPKSIDIVNVGPGFRGHYDVFCPISSFSWLSVDAKGQRDVVAEANCRSNRSRIGEQDALETMERVSNTLIGAESANYTAELEDLYRRMLSKLENLSRQVEMSSAMLLEQEKKNLRLRSKIAGLE